MIDTGSSVNLIKASSIDKTAHASWEDKREINGVTGNARQTLGTIDIEFANTRHKFHLVDDEFPFKEDGVLGAEFFRNENAIICFKNKYLTSRKSGNIQLLNRTDDLITPPRILTTSIGDTPKVHIQAPELANETNTFLVDTGSDINVIKLHALGKNALLKAPDRIQITGSTPGTVETQGVVDILIGNQLEEFHVVGNSFPIKEDGILGTKFLRKENATISFEANKITLDSSDPLKILDENIISIPPRTAQVISIRVNNPSITTGLLKKQDLGKGIMLGKALVTNRDGLAYAYVINTNREAVEIKRPAVTLEEVSEPKHTEYTSNPQILFTTNTRKIDKYNDNLTIAPNHGSKRLEILKENLRLEHCNKEEKKAVIDLAIEYNHLFHLPGDKLGHTHLVSHKIPTTDDMPVHTKQYRYPPVHKEEIKRQVTKLLDQGIIKNSSSPYNFPVCIVPKNRDASGEKKWRMVIDFRKLNEKTIGDAYPLPNITEILDQLGSAKYFSTFDLASGFHQIPMHPEDSAKTAFSTPNGHYEYLRMPFGLKNAPSTFQRLMDQVLMGLQGNEMFIYLDDIVIYARSLEEHAIKFKKLMDRLSNAGLRLQPDKCEFLRKEVAYLGHLISHEGVRPNPETIAAIKNFPQPTNAVSIREFLGLVETQRDSSQKQNDLTRKKYDSVFNKSDSTQKD